MSFWTKNDELIAQAGAAGELRCDTCGIPVTIIDPFETSAARLTWLDCERWVEAGVPKARCTAHYGTPA